MNNYFNILDSYYTLSCQCSYKHVALGTTSLFLFQKMNNWLVELSRQASKDQRRNVSEYRLGVLRESLSPWLMSEFPIAEVPAPNIIINSIDPVT